MYKVDCKSIFDHPKNNWSYALSTSVMDTTDDASAVAVAEPMMTEDGLVNFPNEEVKVR